MSISNLTTVSEKYKKLIQYIIQLEEFQEKTMT